MRTGLGIELECWLSYLQKGLLYSLVWHYPFLFVMNHSFHVVIDFLHCLCVPRPPCCLQSLRAGNCRLIGWSVRWWPNIRMCHPTVTSWYISTTSCTRASPVMTRYLSVQMGANSFLLHAFFVFGVWSKFIWSKWGHKEKFVTCPRQVLLLVHYTTLVCGISFAILVKRKILTQFLKFAYIHTMTVRWHQPFVHGVAIGLFV